MGYNTRSASRKASETITSPYFTTVNKDNRVKKRTGSPFQAPKSTLRRHGPPASSLEVVKESSISSNHSSIQGFNSNETDPDSNNTPIPTMFSSVGEIEEHTLAHSTSSIALYSENQVSDSEFEGLSSDIIGASTPYANAPAIPPRYNHHSALVESVEETKTTDSTQDYRPFPSAHRSPILPANIQHSAYRGRKRPAENYATDDDDENEEAALTTSNVRQFKRARMSEAPPVRSQAVGYDDSLSLVPNQSPQLEPSTGMELLQERHKTREKEKERLRNPFNRPHSVSTSFDRLETRVPHQQSYLPGMNYAQEEAQKHSNQHSAKEQNIQIILPVSENGQDKVETYLSTNMNTILAARALVRHQEKHGCDAVPTEEHISEWLEQHKDEFVKSRRGSDSRDSRASPIAQRINHRPPATPDSSPMHRGRAAGPASHVSGRVLNRVGSRLCGFADYLVRMAKDLNPPIIVAPDRHEQDELILMDESEGHNDKVDQSSVSQKIERRCCCTDSRKSHRERGQESLPTNFSGPYRLENILPSSGALFRNLRIGK